jgi:hypothetical protein
VIGLQRLQMTTNYGRLHADTNVKCLTNLHSDIKMKAYICLLIFVISGHFGLKECYAQRKGATSQSHSYYEVVVYQLDSVNNQFVLDDTIEFSGAISIDRSNIFIRSYDDKPNYILPIQSYYEADSLAPERFHCVSNGKYYTFYFAITDQGQKICTLVTNEYKKIYYGRPGSKELDRNDEFQDRIIFFDDLPEKPQQTYLEGFLGRNPVLVEAQSLEESKEIIRKRIRDVLEESVDTIPPVVVYASFVVTREGGIRDISILQSNAGKMANELIIKEINSSNQWVAGMINNKTVDVQGLFNSISVRLNRGFFR